MAPKRLFLHTQKAKRTPSGALTPLSKEKTRMKRSAKEVYWQKQGLAPLHTEQTVESKAEQTVETTEQTVASKVVPLESSQLYQSKITISQSALADSVKRALEVEDQRQKSSGKRGKRDKAKHQQHEHQHI
jgi:hypothetical protein